MIAIKTYLENIPEDCNDCCFWRNDKGVFGKYNDYIDSNDYCELTHREINNIYLIPDWCPLIEVKDDKLE